MSKQQERHTTSNQAGIRQLEHPCTKSVLVCMTHADIAEAEGALRQQDTPLHLQLATSEACSVCYRPHELVLLLVH